MNVALFGRDTDLHAEAANLVGNLSSTMLVPVDVSPTAAPSLRALCKACTQRTLNTMEHSVCTSGTDTMSRINNRDGTHYRAVAPFVFASVLDQRPTDVKNPFNWFGTTPSHTALTTPQVWLDVQVFDDVDGSLFFNWDAHVERFLRSSLRLCSTRSGIGWRSWLQTGQRALDRRPVLPPNPKQKVHCLNEAALRPGLQPTLMHKAILEQAIATPHADAVFDASSGLTFTFEKIVRLARSFAAAIVNVTDRFCKSSQQREA